MRVLLVLLFALAAGGASAADLKLLTAGAYKSAALEIVADFEKKTGHKVIMWNGVSDPCCSDIELRRYYADAAKIVGGDAAIAKFATYYPIPGMGHCGGGTGPQDGPDALLQQLMGWVEHGVYPGPAVAHRGADRVKLIFSDPNAKQESGVMIPPPMGGSRDFLLCPAPTVSTYNKTGAVNDAANWSCRTPKMAAKKG